MLHNNISATLKPFNFNAAQAEINPVFQDINQGNDRPQIFEIASSTAIKDINESDLSTPEQRNILLAKNIAQHRQTLKSMLSEIPLSALWLLNNYGQECYKDTETGTEQYEVNPDELLNMLANCYQNAASKTAEFGLDSPEAFQSKKSLSEALKALPLTAEQLKNLATTITHAYAIQASENPLPTQSDINIQAGLAKKMHRLANVSVEKLKYELQHLGLLTGNIKLTAFLLPPDNQLHTSLRHLIRTEELWLRARQKLAEANSRLVLFMANQYKGGFLDFNDLVQEGQSGLLKAVDRFDYQRGFKFSTYAVYWIRQGISRSLTRSERVVRLPFGQMANIGKVHRAKEAYFAKTGQEITIQALAEQTQLAEADIYNILLIGQGATSLDTPVGDEESDSTLSDFMEQQVYPTPIQTIASQELIVVINAAINELSEKEAKVICCRFGIHCQNEMTLEEIGHELNLTRERVRQIQTTALKKLKQQFGTDLASFL